jgi:hypothetical protein
MKHGQGPTGSWLAVLLQSVYSNEKTSKLMSRLGVRTWSVTPSTGLSDLLQAVGRLLIEMQPCETKEII